MRLLLILTVVMMALSSKYSVANEFDGYSEFLVSHIKKLQQYMAKNRKCHLAFLEVEDLSKTQSYESPWMNTLYCIADVAQSAGTVDEKSGCFVLQFDTKKGRYQDIYKKRSKPEPPYVAKSCDTGFSKLMNKKFKWLHTDKQKYTPWEYLLDTEGRYGCLVKRHLIYASNGKVESEFQSQNDRYHKKLVSKCQAQPKK